MARADEGLVTFSPEHAEQMHGGLFQSLFQIWESIRTASLTTLLFVNENGRRQLCGACMCVYMCVCGHVPSCGPAGESKHTVCTDFSRCTNHNINFILS